MARDAPFRRSNAVGTDVAVETSGKLMEERHV